MTREEAVIILDGFKNNPLFSDTHVQALDMAISALSENKGDLISRQAVLDGIAEWIVSGYADSEADCSHISSLVTHLPSVENKGEWIEESDNYGHSSYFCSRCGTQEGKPSGFYPNCGAKMKGGE